MVERLDLAAQPEIRDSGDRSANEIRRKIAMERETIKDTVDKLSGRLQQSLDWREYVGAHPAVALGLAAGTGLLLSAIFKRERSPGERIKQAVADLAEDLTERVSGVAGDAINRSRPAERTLKAAATTLAAQAAIDFVKRKIGEQGGAGRRIERTPISTRRGRLGEAPDNNDFALE
jgi:ElaB/YqjD/DUF883 family membrane-anchored ribosome-binding protein